MQYLIWSSILEQLEKHNNTVDITTIWYMQTLNNMNQKNLSSRYSKECMNIRSEVLSILFKEFGNGSPTNNMRIYECADKLMKALNCD